MANGKRKRRKSRSPSPSTAARRVRRYSLSRSVALGGSTHSQSDLSRAKSVFRGNSDPYFPQKSERATSVHAGEDWAFRVSVISCSTDINDTVFKKAVQGLVQICFPEGILDQLGIDILEQHMRAEHAPEKNILRMNDIFRSEMVHRATWMLAEYLDTPNKVEAGVESVVAASASIHGSKLGDDVLGQIVANLRHLRKQVPHDSTRHLSAGTVIQDRVHVDTSSPAYDSNDHAGNTSESGLLSSDKSASQPRKRRQTIESCERILPQDATPQDTSAHAEIQATRSKQSTLKSSVLNPAPRVSKISSSWIWDIESAGMSTTEISNHFTKTADLFAYHAMPIVKKKLGIQARRKELRHTMEKMLSELLDTEYIKWVESYDKLLKGDHEMLIRAEIDLSRQERDIGVATPAPVDILRRSPRGPNAVSVKSNKSMKAHADNAAQLGTNNCEGVFKPAIATANSPSLKEQEHITPEVSSISHSVEAIHAIANQPTTSHKAEKSYVSSAENHVQSTETWFETRTPIIDLLQGSSVLRIEENRFVEFIMNNLSKRVSSDSIMIHGYRGRYKVETKSELATGLKSIPIKTTATGFSFAPGSREAYESRLRDWVSENPAAFPEFHSLPVMFTSILSCRTIVSNILFSHRRLAKDQVGIEELATSIIAGLKQRITFYNCKVKHFDALRLKAELLDIMKSGTYYRSKRPKRVAIERALRWVVFYNRFIFPQLKTSPLVRAWEQKTGQLW